jgi:hypothetical protein
VSEGERDIYMFCDRGGEEKHCIRGRHSVVIEGREMGRFFCFRREHPVELKRSV